MDIETQSLIVRCKEGSHLTDEEMKKLNKFYTKLYEMSSNLGEVFHLFKNNIRDEMNRTKEYVEARKRK